MAEGGEVLILEILLLVIVQRFHLKLAVCYGHLLVAFVLGEQNDLRDQAPNLKHSKEFFLANQ